MDNNNKKKRNIVGDHAKMANKAIKLRSTLIKLRNNSNNNIEEKLTHRIYRPNNRMNDTQKKIESQI